MKPSKEMVQKYQEQQNKLKLLSNNSDLISQEYLINNKMNHHGFYSNLSSSQMNSTKLSMPPSIFQLSSSTEHNTTHEKADYQEEALKAMLKMNNYHSLQLKDLIRLQANNSAFNLMKSKEFNTNQQLHNSMMSDEAFAEDLSDHHSPDLDDEFMSDEQISEDEQPLDFSIKSKKGNDHHEKSSIKQEQLTRSFDQVDGDWTRSSTSNGTSKRMPMFNSDLSSFYANQFTSPKLNSQSNIMNLHSNNSNRYAFVNPLLLAESQSNLIHSEPSSPEGLSSASSTSSRSSSQGYYSGSSFNGTPHQLNITPSMYSNAFNQSLTAKPPTTYLQQTAPPSYASLNFSTTTHQNKPISSSSLRTPNQQVRPSVIVSTTTNSKTNRQLASSSRNEPSFTATSDKVVDQSIDEHFRLSLGDSFYNKMLNSQSTPTKDISKKLSPSSIDNHFNRSSQQDSTVIESSMSVDDHFAKALGETWFKLKKDNSN